MFLGKLELWLSDLVSVILLYFKDGNNGYKSWSVKFKDYDASFSRTYFLPDFRQKSEVKVQQNDADKI